MRVGVPTEIREEEYRVALTPAGTKELTSRGHEVLVQHGAGEGSFFPDEAYVAAGARIVPDAEALFAQADLIVKVKEPLREEYLRLTPRHVLFTYLHLAPDPELTKALVDGGATCLAYETVETVEGRKPLLAPMSEIAGRLATQVGAYFLERMSGGKGKLLGGVTGVKAASVVILGAGIAGTNAAAIAVGMGACTNVLDIDMDALGVLRKQLPGVQTLHSDQLTIEEQVAKADLVIGAILVSGARTPVLVTEDTVRAMQPGSVIVDLSVDQGGCVATSRTTSHREPTFVKHGVIHYCVDNMAGVVPITSTLALTNVTLPYILEVAEKGAVGAARSDPSLARGVNVMEGKVTHREVAEATGNPYFPLEYVLPIEYT
ncbi:MAG: alanine dehydrogenase [Actinobacteria bacterium RBG_16_64_13]|nr:MAG: alanine dehydrogenase [Actinobacteria bacterium RBG_16_64_13]